MIQEAYNRETFLRFLRTFLPDDYVQNVVQRTNPAHKFTQSVMELGKCASLDLMVFEIHHSSSNDARVGIAQETFRLMNSLACRRALIVFIPENSDQWRFSLLEITLEWDEKKINRTFSNPRRHSYLLGKNAHTKTPEHFIIKKGPIRARREGNKDLTPWEDLQSRFSVEALTKEFYNKLYNWYLWAVSPYTKVTFPNHVSTSSDDRDDMAIKIIRLITRLLFVWFIKQKGLVPKEIFDEDELQHILANFDPQSETDGKYYNAILQNLFFATLNNEVNKRRFMSEPFHGRSGSFGVKTLFRDSKKASWFKISHDKVLQLFHNVPFMNCGLFECLDRYEKTNINQEKDVFLDGFSSRDTRQDKEGKECADGQLKYRAFVPNILFFAKEEEWRDVMVEKDGKPQKDKVMAMGLIPLLKLYNFTVQENTPSEVEVSLDPELLGQVFENLLAAYNPETKGQATDRKSTGSFYTPRPIVEYMVNESLIEYLKTKVPSVAENNWRMLISYENDSAEDILTPDERVATLNALYECKILDPACGSGAFPMGMLQQMVHITSKLDSVFDPYQTKLRIINNCIYGSDIQPIAMLISKLRFFISLICEQDDHNVNFADEENNFGINTLPNLETKFVAANSLLTADIHKYADDDWTLDPNLIKLKNELLKIRQEHFSVRTQTSKLRKREEDRLKRQEIQDYILQSTTQPNAELVQMYESRIRHLTAERELYEGEKIVEEIVDTQASLFDEAQPQVVRKDINKIHRDRIDAEIAGLRKSIAKEQNKRNSDDFCTAIQQIADWNPYDQLKAAPFFDADWMFGITKGFDIVIGNPPYISVRTKSFDSSLKPKYKELYNLAVGQYDLYTLFIELGEKILVQHGILSFIIPTRMLSNENFMAARKFLMERMPLMKYVNAQRPFDANVEANIMVCKRNEIEPDVIAKTLDNSSNTFSYLASIPFASILNMPFNIFPFVFKQEVLDVLFKIQREHEGEFVSDYLEITRGFECGYDDDRIGHGKYKFIYAETIEPYLLGAQQEIYCDPDFRDTSKYKTKDVFCCNPKLVTKFCSNEIKFAIDEVGYCNTNSIYNCAFKSNMKKDLYYLLGILNSKLTTFWFNTAFLNIDSIFPHIQKNQLESIPVHNGGKFHSEIAELAKSICKKKRNDTSDLENQIDILVYLLYKLTYDEVRIIDPEIETIISEAEYNKRLAENA